MAMKKRIQRIAGILAALAMLPAPVQGYAAEPLIPGDLDYTRISDDHDVDLLTAYLSGEPIGRFSEKAADLNQDGILDARDLTLLKQRQLNQKAVMMVYMSGSTLETDDELQCASEDIQEMVQAAGNPNLTVVILTGGAEKWHNEYAKEDANYRIVINKNGVTSSKYAETTRSMGDADTLGSFIRDTKQAYPADHYGLVMWGHGSGPLYGMCYDSLTKDTMTLPEFRAGLQTGGLHFDWIGLDCCLMGTIETLKAAEDHCEYLVASEIQTSKYGWKYDGFLNDWAKYPGMNPKNLTKRIADEVVAGNADDPGSVQIACYDVARTERLWSAYLSFLPEFMKALENPSAESVFMDIPDFSRAGYDIIDLKTVAKQVEMLDQGAKTRWVPLETAAPLIEQIENTVYYNRLANIYAFGGIAFWFPRVSYEDGYKLVRKTFEPLYIDDTYITMMEEYCDPKNFMIID